MEGTRIAALRGATGSHNTPEDITLKVADLWDALLNENNLQESDIVSVIFSVTDDLDAMNPAAALRKSGRGAETALFAVAEARSVGSIPGMIRVLIHCLIRSPELRHVYMHGAERLRPDRTFLNPLSS